MSASMSLTIQDFSALMRNDQENGFLMEILRKLTLEEFQQRVLDRFVPEPPPAGAWWGGWR